MLTQSSLDAHVLARDLGDVELVGTARLTKIWVALSDRQIAGALFGVTLGFAATPWEPVLT